MWFSGFGLFYLFFFFFLDYFIIAMILLSPVWLFDLYDLNNLCSLTRLLYRGQHCTYYISVHVYMQCINLIYA